MTGQRSDRIRLGDMLRSVARLEEILRGGYDSFAGSWLKQSAAIRELEIVGEAAGDVSAAARKAHPKIGWAAMRGFSSFAKHEYWRVDPAFVWQAIREMPAIRDKLAKVIPRAP